MKPISPAICTFAVRDAVKNRKVFGLFALLAISWLPALTNPNVIQSATGLFPLAESMHPYFAPVHAEILYFRTPLVAISASLLFLSPGLFLSLALDAAEEVGHWVLSAFALSLVLVSVATGIVQAITGTSLRGEAFAAVVVGCSLVCFGFLLVRLIQTRSLVWPLSQPHARVTALSMVVVPWLILTALAPKFYWENFNGDGAHAFESTRLLLFQSLPFFPPTAGDIASFPGITSMLFAFPASWFIRLFGETEASVRLPILLYLVALYGGVIALVQNGRGNSFGMAERWLIWLSLIVYVIVVAFSATYNPYSADIALPATQDTLLMVCFFGFTLAFLKQNKSWMFLFIALTMVSLPNGVLLIGMWLLSVAFVWRPRPWNWIVMTSAMLLCCFVLAAVAQRLLYTNELPVPGNEYGLVGLLKRFAFLQVTDWRRIGFMVVACGILPAMGLLAWRWQDRVARTMTVVTIAYFGFFYIQAHIALHHFIPVMLLPLIVFWRNNAVINPRYRQAVLASSGIAGLVALLISLPQHAGPDISARVLGVAIEDRIVGYESLEPESFRRSEILRHLFPYDWEPSVPLESYGGSPLTFNYYAHHKNGVSHNVNYVVQPITSQAPNGMRIVAAENGAALYVRSDSVWQNHRAMRPPTPAGSDIYALPRGILFRSVPLTNGPSIVNVVDVIEGFGFDMTPILDRLGVKR